MKTATPVVIVLCYASCECPSVAEYFAYSYRSHEEIAIKAKS